MNKIIVIDGNSLMNRAFYALPLLTAPDGRHTNAVYGFINILFKIIAENQPTHIVVAFDMKAPTFRHKMYADYKGTRHKMPDELAEQMPLIKTILDSLKIKYLQQEGIEADDIIGTLAKRFEDKTIILTGDKDCLQLIDSSTEVWLTKKGISEIAIMNEATLMEEMSLTPSQIIDLKAIMGDAADNIPGIPGIGEKGAKDFLAKYGTVDSLYEHLEDLAGAKLQKVQDGKELAFLSKKLATIDTTCDIDCELRDIELHFPFSKESKQMLANLQFSSIVKRKDLFLDNDTSIQQIGFDFELKNSENIVELQNETDVIKLLQTNNINKMAIFVNNSTIHFAIDNSNEYVVSNKMFNLFNNILEKDSIIKIFYNAKRTIKQLSTNMPNVFFDVLLAQHLVKNVKDIKNIENNLEEFGFIENNFAVSLYNAYSTLQDKLKEDKINNIYYNMELPLESVLFNMESYGIKVDKSILDSLRTTFSEELIQIEKSIYSYAGKEFNINSPKQLAEILFDHLQIPLGKNKKRSTSYEILIEIESLHPIVREIIKHRKISKIVSTYLDGIVKYIDKDNTIHTEFEQAMTSTGRLSSNNPNLQNIPIKNDDGKQIRAMFVPHNENNIFISADYNQIELRLMAHFSQDKNLVKAFNDGIDVHSATASEIFNVPLTQVTPEMRRIAKTVNFGIIYGISEYGLSQNLKISPKQAKLYIEKYFETYNGVKKHLDTIIKKAKQDGFVQSLLGRKRLIPELNSPNKTIQKFGERVAMNTPLQSTGSEIIKLAMLEVDKKFKESNIFAEIVLQIHDELIVECNKQHREKVATILRNTMENIVKLSVPIPVTIEQGSSMYEI